MKRILPSAALASLTACAIQPATPVDGLERMLASHDSATAALEQWCEQQGLANPARVVAQQVPGQLMAAPADLPPLPRPIIEVRHVSTLIGLVESGLGLAVVHGIVEAHRGAITVASQPGQGTTFRFQLRVTENLPSALSSTATVDVNVVVYGETA